MKYSRFMTVAGLLILAACSGNDVKTTLGLDRGAPDEFRVVSRPPLSVPPQFNLRAPGSPADTASSQPPTSAQAQALLTGNTVPAVAVTAPASTAVAPAAVPAGTTAESAFLKNVGAAQADPKVRDEIVQDQIVAATPPPEEKSWYNFWDSTPPQKESLVNAGQESQRIKTNADAGQPVTQGDTPVVKQKDTGLLGQIFGY